MLSVDLIAWCKSRNINPNDSEKIAFELIKELNRLKSEILKLEERDL